ncbi:MAG: hypothetical protein Q8930_09655, partial [Bacillota bacterium]|nr:hypothetical protein [Bacillota bacterium]
ARAVLKSVFQIWFLAALIDAAILYIEGHKLEIIVIIVPSLAGVIFQTAAYFRKYGDFRKIKNMDRFKVRVIRNGITEAVPSSELVMGDIVLLHKGEVVPADMRVIECERFKVMEGSITGDNRPVEKYATKIEEEVSSISNIRNMLFKSSIVVDGYCQAIIIAVGRSTFAATTLQAMEKANPEEVGILEACKKKVNLHLLSILMISLAAAGITFFVTDSLKEAIRTLESLFLFGSVYGFALVGGMLAASIKLHLDVRGINILNYSALLKIPKINVSITGKLGVISEKRMILKEIYTDRLAYNANLKEKVWSSNISRIFNIALYCNTYNELTKNTNPDYNYMIDKGLAFHIEKVLKYSVEGFKHERRFIIPFDNERRMMTAVYKLEGKYRSYTKGLLDSVINNCTLIMRNGLEVELLKEDIEHAKNKAVEMESRGLTVIALAYRSFNYEPAPGSNIESNMVFVGLTALDNYILDEGKEYIDVLRKSGIRPILFTEDTKLTAYNWGKRLGILKGINEVMSGIEMDNLSQEDFLSSFGKVSIYSKLNPSNKSRVIKAFKEKGAYAAFTCSSMSDMAPAVNSDFNIIYNEQYERTLRSFSGIAVKDNYIKNIIYIIRRTRLFLRQVNNSLEFMLFSLIAFLVLKAAGSGISIPDSDYGRILWMNLFNLPLLQVIILLDRTKEEPDENNSVIEKVKVLRSYFEGAAAGLIILLIQLIFGRYLGFYIGDYLLFNLVMLLIINKFRIKNRKIISMANVFYSVIIIFNVVLIFVMNR